MFFLESLGWLEWRLPNPYHTQKELDEDLKCWTRKTLGEPSSLNSKIYLIFAKIVCALEMGLRNIFELASLDLDDSGPSFNILKCRDCGRFWDELGQK